MTTLPLRPAFGSTATGRLPVTLAALAGAGLVIAGSLLPWLSLYGGLQALHGTDGTPGRLLLALALGLVVAASWWARSGLPAARFSVMALGTALLGLSGWLAVGLLSTARDLAADPLLISRIEPGLPVAVAGAALAFATWFLPAGARARPDVPVAVRDRLDGRTLVVAGLTAAAGIVHLALVPEHLAEDRSLGVAFAMAGAAQLALAAGLVLTRARAILAASAGLGVVLVAAYLVAVTVGLPIGGLGVGSAAPADHAAAVADHDAAVADHGDADHGDATADHGAGGHAAGTHVEAVDDLGALTVGAEAIAVVLAVRRLRRPA